MAIAQIPFMKLVEDVMLEVRENSTEAVVEAKYKRRVNDIYARDLPAIKEFQFMRTTTSVTIPAAYRTGTASVASGGTAVTGVGTTWTSTMTGRKIKFDGNDDIYVFTYVGPTSATISPAYTGSTALSGGGYTIYQDTFSLSGTYDRIVDPPGFYYDYANGRVLIRQRMNPEWFTRWTTTRAQFPDGWRLMGLDSTNLYWQVQFAPPLDTARIVNYEYIPLYTDMTEYTTGTCATAAGSATVTGIGTDFTNNVQPGDAFRMDSASSDWYLVASVGGATSLNLTANYPATKATAAYTICKVPRMPVHLHMAIFFGACWMSSQDQDNENSLKNYYKLYRQAIEEYMAVENRSKFGRQKSTVKDQYRRFER